MREAFRVCPYQTILAPPWDSAAVTALALGAEHFFTEVMRGHIKLGGALMALDADTHPTPAEMLVEMREHLEAGQCVLIMSNKAETRDRMRRDILAA
jgi:hypothetical protein